MGLFGNSTERRTTTWSSELEGGWFSGHGGAWLYRTAPTSIIAGADLVDVEAGAHPMLNALDAIAKHSRTKFGRRSASREGYREVHVLAVNVPRRFKAQPSKIADDLNESFATRTPPQRVVALGARLRDDTINSADSYAQIARDATRQLANFLISPESVDRSRYRRDEQTIDAILARSRFATLPADERRVLRAWWNWGRWTDTPYLPHADHIHYITDAEAKDAIERHPGGRADCSQWADVIRGQHAVTWASVWDWDNHAIYPHDPSAMWAERLFAAGALAISIRGRLEPSRITSNELHRRREQIVQDINERAAQNKLDRAQQDERLERLEYAEALVSHSDALPTLIDARVTIAFSGMDFDLESVGDFCNLRLKPLDDRQRRAHFEWMPASTVVANPHAHDLSISVLAYSGITSFTQVGDDNGALLGFTETDGQPVYIGPESSTTADGAPCISIAGGTGSGKTYLGQNLAKQFIDLGHPVIFVNPKQQDSLRPFANAVNGTVVTLDDLASTDGVLDPFRYAGPNEAPSLALAFILAANPWGVWDDRGRIETSLSSALRFGAGRNASCVGEALGMAVDAGRLDPAIRDKIFELDDPLFMLGCGRRPHGERLRAAEGLTLIEAGSTFFSLPAPNRPVESWDLTERVSVAALRLLVFGSGYALAKRAGVVFFDEAHTFFAAGSSLAELNRLGRLARSQEFLIALLTQRVSDIVDAGLRDFVSRVIGLSLEGDEAAALCELLKVDPTEERIARIQDTAGDRRGLRAIYGPGRRLQRGSVCFLRDLKGRVATVEVTVPEHLALTFTTNKVDRQLRAAAEERTA